MDYNAGHKSRFRYVVIYLNPWFLDDRYDEDYDRIASTISLDAISFGNLLWDTLSKAFIMSKRITMIKHPFLRALVIASRQPVI